MIVVFVFDGKSPFRARHGFFVFVVVLCPNQIAEIVSVFQHRASGFFNIDQLVFVVIISLNPDFAFGGIFLCNAAVAVDAVSSLILSAEVAFVCYPVPGCGETLNAAITVRCKEQTTVRVIVHDTLISAVSVDVIVNRSGISIRSGC